MPTLIAFINISLDGYYADANDSVQWAYKAPDDTEWNEFVAGNAQGGGALVMGRVTYDMMAGYWPTPMAMQNSADVATHMNTMEKMVFSRTMQTASWQNSTVHDDLVSKIRELKAGTGPSMAVLGSGSIVRQLVVAGLVDELQLVINPVLLGSGKRLFESLEHSFPLSLLRSRTFANGNVVLSYTQ